MKGLSGTEVQDGSQAEVYVKQQCVLVQGGWIQVLEALNKCTGLDAQQAAVHWSEYQEEKQKHNLRRSVSPSILVLPNGAQCLRIPHLLNVLTTVPNAAFARRMEGIRRRRDKRQVRTTTRNYTPIVERPRRPQRNKQERKGSADRTTCLGEKCSNVANHQGSLFCRKHVVPPGPQRKRKRRQPKKKEEEGESDDVVEEEELEDFVTTDKVEQKKQELYQVYPAQDQERHGKRRTRTRDWKRFKAAQEALDQKKLPTIYINSLGCPSLFFFFGWHHSRFVGGDR